MPLIVHSWPGLITSWTCEISPAASALVEIAIALLIAAGPVWQKLSIVGSLGGIGMFLTTLNSVITTPGVWQAGYGFPALAASLGQFLVKDVVLSGAAIRTLADSLRYVGAGNGAALETS